jgi:hypothetical protein
MDYQAARQVHQRNDSLFCRQRKANIYKLMYLRVRFNDISSVYIQYTGTNNEEADLGTTPMDDRPL